MPYAKAAVATESIAPPGEATTASGNGGDAPERRRRFRRKRAEGKAEGPGSREKRRPGAYLDVLI